MKRIPYYAQIYSVQILLTKPNIIDININRGQNKGVFYTSALLSAWPVGCISFY